MIKTDLIEKARRFLTRRKGAYCRMFDSLENQDALIVLKDLAKFCRAHKTTFTKDERLSLLLEGRKEVWLRIQQHLNLSDDDLWDLYHKGE